MEALICQPDLISWEFFAWQALRSVMCGDIVKGHPALGLFSLIAFPCGLQHWQGQCEPYQESQQSLGDKNEEQGDPGGVCLNLLMREKAQADVSQLKLQGWRRRALSSMTAGPQGMKATEQGCDIPGKVQQVCLCKKAC